MSLVHFLGMPCDMDSIRAIAERHNLKVVEDCAIAVGSRFHGLMSGCLAKLGVSPFIQSNISPRGRGDGSDL